MPGEPRPERWLNRREEAPQTAWVWLMHRLFCAIMGIKIGALNKKRMIMHVKKGRRTLVRKK
jgi:hypothetical protein